MNAGRRNGITNSAGFTWRLRSRTSGMLSDHCQGCQGWVRYWNRKTLLILFFNGKMVSKSFFFCQVRLPEGRGSVWLCFSNTLIWRWTQAMSNFGCAKLETLGHGCDLYRPSAGGDQKRSRRHGGSESAKVRCGAMECAKIDATHRRIHA